jgi:hypothetical protein
MQTVTFMDAAGNVAQYTVFDANGQGRYQWATDQGGNGTEISAAQAQTTARNSLKASMALRFKTEQMTRYRSEPKRSQHAVSKVVLLPAGSEKAPGRVTGLEGEIAHLVRWRLGPPR